MQSMALSVPRSGSLDAYVHTLAASKCCPLRKGIGNASSKMKTLSLRVNWHVSPRFVVHIVKSYPATSFPRPILSGRQHWPNESRKVSTQQLACVWSLSLFTDQSWNSRICVAQLAHCKSGDHQSPTQIFFNLRKAKKRLGWFSQEEVQPLQRTG